MQIIGVLFFIFYIFFSVIFWSLVRHELSLGTTELLQLLHVVFKSQMILLVYFSLQIPFIYITPAYHMRAF